MHSASCSDRHSRESEASTPGRETSGLWKGPLSRKVGSAKSLLKTCGRAGLWLFLLRRCSQLQSQRACPPLMDTRATPFKLVPGPSCDGDVGPTMASLLVWRSSQCLQAGQVSHVYGPQTEKQKKHKKTLPVPCSRKVFEPHNLRPQAAKRLPGAQIALPPSPPCTEADDGHQMSFLLGQYHAWSRSSATFRLMLLACRELREAACPCGAQRRREPLASARL
jgi:hypothetical protein